MENAAKQKFEGKTVLMFDVYGTLIDWETGIFNALLPVFHAHGVYLSDATTLEMYAKHEAALEAGPYLSYREILAQGLELMGQELGFTPRAEDLESFSHSVGDWPAFPDSQEALSRLKKRFKLAVITNCDDGFFALSKKRLGVSNT